MSVFDFFKKKSIDFAPVPHIDTAGNIFYPLDLFLSSRRKVRTDYDMRRPLDRELASAVCTPLAGVLDKLGDMLSRAEVYVTDAEGNELDQYDDVRALLERPNPLQTCGGFLKQIEKSLRLHGFAVLKIVRPIQTATPTAMWVVPPVSAHIKATGKMLSQFEEQGVVSRVMCDRGGDKVELKRGEYAIIAGGEPVVPPHLDADIFFVTAADTLSFPVNNWIASMAANATLLVNGGPKGILHGESTDSFGQPALTKPDEEDIREQFKRKYGLVGKKYPVLVTRHQLRWQPMDFNAAQLRIEETDDKCTAKICNALGLNPNLFTDAKYDNQESAKKAAYQDVVIPDSMKIAAALTDALLPNGGQVVLDYSAVECLQESKREEADVLSNAADALLKLTSGGLLSQGEARQQLAKYIDIDPADYAGGKNTQEDE